MPKKQTSLRLNDLTAQQIDELTELWNMTQAEVVALAVERLYQQEVKDKKK